MLGRDVDGRRVAHVNVKLREVGVVGAQCPIGQITHGLAVLVRDLDQAAEVVDALAPEHLCIQVAEPRAFLDKVRFALRDRGLRNAQLVKTEGARLPVGSEHVDCVYSFIVLQHVETYAVFKRYFEETYRVLKPGGLAVLYFARRYRWSFNRGSRLLYGLDRLLEPLLLRKGYEELPAPVNSTNLRVSLRQATSQARAIGFQVMRTLVSRRRVPDGAVLYGGQHGLLLKKPELRLPKPA